MFTSAKYLILTLILMSASLLVSAQKRPSDKIYWLALDKYTLALDSGRHPTLNLFQEKKIYLQKPEYVDSIPPQINGYNIILITGQTQKKLYKDHKGQLIHTIMFPVAVEDSLLYITITPYRGKLKGSRHYYLGVSDGITIYFKYNAIKKQFVVDKVKNWGI
jgi:hypothetical protein